VPAVETPPAHASPEGEMIAVGRGGAGNIRSRSASPL